MVVALAVVAILLFVAVVLLSSAFGAASAESSIRAKVAAFDAAEAGLNRAVATLDETRGTSEACGDNQQGVAGPELADGGSYVWCIEYNGLVHHQAGKVSARGTTAEINVPKGTVYVWSTGTAIDGGRGVSVEALVAPSAGMPLPAGALAAGGDVDARGNIGIYESAPGMSDASVHANGSILVSRPPSVVQGDTFAVGVDQMVGDDGKKNGYAQPAPMPNANQISAAAQNAQAAAGGSAPIMQPPVGSELISGDALIQGDLELPAGTVTFERGQSVFINGDVCVSGRGRIINDGSTIWVTGTVSTVGSDDGYSVMPGTTGSLIVLGLDTAPQCSNSPGRFALSLDAEGTQDVGLLYAASGSIDVVGGGTIVGAVASGRDIVLDGASGNAIQLDPLANHPVPTYDFRVISYMEY